MHIYFCIYKKHTSFTTAWIVLWIEKHASYSFEAFRLPREGNNAWVCEREKRTTYIIVTIMWQVDWNRIYEWFVTLEESEKKVKKKHVYWWGEKNEKRGPYVCSEEKIPAYRNIETHTLTIPRSKHFISQN